jgi:sialidase-1
MFKYLLVISLVNAIPVAQSLQRFGNASNEYYINHIWWEGISLTQNKPMFKSTIIFSCSDKFDNIMCFRIPSLLVLTNNTVIAFSEARINSCEDCSITGIVSKRSINGGKSWGPISWVVKPTNINGIENSNRGANPTSLYDSKNNKIVLHFSRGGKSIANSDKWDCVPAHSNWQITSIDNGITWSKPYRLDSFLKDWKGILPGPGNGIQLSDNERYIFPGHFGTSERSNGAVIVYYSDDYGITYKVANNSFSRMDESTLVELGNGSVLINMRNTNENLTRAYSISNDNGLNWDVIRYDNQLIDPICEGSLSKIDNIILFSNPTMKYARSNLTIHYRDSLLKQKWRSLRLVDETVFSDYSSLANKLIWINNKAFLPILWGSCKLPISFRVWCAKESSWEINYTLIPWSNFKF